MDTARITLTLGREAFRIKREATVEPDSPEEHPDDLSDEVVGQ